MSTDFRALHDKASGRSQVFPLSGATVYQHVMHSGEVSHSKDPGEGCVLEVVRVGMGVGPQCISM